MPSSTVQKLLPSFLQPRFRVEPKASTHIGRLFSRTTNPKPNPRKVRRPHTPSVADSPCICPIAHPYGHLWRTHVSAKVRPSGYPPAIRPSIRHRRADGRASTYNSRMPMGFSQGKSYLPWASPLVTTFVWLASAAIGRPDIRQPSFVLMQHRSHAILGLEPRPHNAGYVSQTSREIQIVL